MLQLHYLTGWLLFSLALTSQSIGQDERIFFVKIAKANGLQGQITEVTEFKVATSFGDVTIPIDKIEAVKMRAGNDGAAVIALVNGDMITGTIDIKELHLTTAWGKAHINAESVDSFSTSEYGRFYTDPSGGGWRYSRGGSVGNNNPLNQNYTPNQSGYPVK